MKRQRIEQLLPSVFRRTAAPGTPLFALLNVMEALHQPSEIALRSWEIMLDPRRTNENWAPFLACWLNLEPIFAPHAAGSAVEHMTDWPISTGLGRLRELTAIAARLAQWSGTARGLLLFLETATGESGFSIDELVVGQDGLPKPFHMRICAPASTSLHRNLLERIIEFEKPAYVTYELAFAAAGSRADKP